MPSEEVCTNIDELYKKLMKISIKRMQEMGVITETEKYSLLKKFKIFESRDQFHIFDLFLFLLGKIEELYIEIQKIKERECLNCQQD